MTGHSRPAGARAARTRPSPGRRDIRAARLLKAVVTALLLGPSACLPSTPPSAYDSGTVSLPAPARRPAPDARVPVRLQFLGVAGWRIETPRTVLLTGTLLTRPGMFEVGLGKVLRPDTSAIAGALAAWNVGPLDRTAAVLVGHGHYDHLLDAPWLLADAAPRARLLTNRTSRLQILPLLDSLGVDRDRVEDVSAAAATPVRPGRWIRIGPDLRVMPVRNDHAPHFAGHTLYSGIRRVAPEDIPGAGDQWLDGESLAFLVDVLAPDGSVALRIYWQDAIPRDPAGQIPAALLEEREVDVALLVPASFAEVRWHPESLVGNLRPRRVLVHHWEDFFAPALEPAEPVAFTILPEFMARLRRAMGCDACIHLPRPGTRYEFVPEAPGGGGVDLRGAEHAEGAEGEKGAEGVVRSVRGEGSGPGQG